jgi:hypothetical protein
MMRKRSLMKIELGISKLKLSFSIEVRKTTESKLFDLGVREVGQFMALCHDQFRDRFRSYLDLDDEAFAELMEQMEQQMPMKDHNRSHSVKLLRFPLSAVFEDEATSFSSTAERFIPEDQDIPDSASHVDALPPVRDQGTRGTCVAHATVALREFLTGKPGIDLSEQFLYFKCKENDFHAGKGTYISTSMEVLVNDGVCREETWRYEPVNMNGNEGMGPAPLQASSEALNHRINSYHSIDSHDISTIKQAIAGSSGRPGVVVVVGILVFDTSWNKYTEMTGKYIMPYENSTPEGGHAILLVGFQDDEDYPGGGYFIFRNSYGEGWAPESAYEAGYGTIPYEYIKKYNRSAYLSFDLKENIMDKQKKREKVFHFKKGFTPIIDKINGKEALMLCRDEDDHARFGTRGMVFLGRVSETNDKDGSRFYNVPVYWDMQNHQILFICGKNGSGKSHAMAVIIEGFLESNTGAGAVIIDSHGEHYSFKFPSDNSETLKEWDLFPKGYDNVQILAPQTESAKKNPNVDGTFNIRVADLQADDWINMLKISGKEQRSLMEHIVKSVREGYTLYDKEFEVEEYVHGRSIEPDSCDDYEVKDLLFCLKYDKSIHSAEYGYPISVRRGVGKKLNESLKWAVISKEGTPISDIIRPDVLTVIDIQDPGISEDQRKTIVGILARKIFDKRATSARYDEGLVPKPDDYIPVTYFFVDEMHLLAGNGKSDISTKALIRIAKEGRKRGISLIAASQQPGATNDEIISQIDGIIGHQLGFEGDVKQFKKRIVAECPQEIDTAFLRKLPRGYALAGEMKSPARMFVLQIRPRKSLHGGNSQIP